MTCQIDRSINISILMNIAQKIKELTCIFYVSYNISDQRRVDAEPNNSIYLNSIFNYMILVLWHAKLTVLYVLFLMNIAQREHFLYLLYLGPTSRRHCLWLVRRQDFSPLICSK